MSGLTILEICLFICPFVLVSARERWLPNMEYLLPPAMLVDNLVNAFKGGLSSTNLHFCAMFLVVRPDTVNGLQNLAWGGHWYVVYQLTGRHICTYKSNTYELWTVEGESIIGSLKHRPPKLCRIYINVIQKNSSDVAGMRGKIQSKWEGCPTCRLKT